MNDSERIKILIELSQGTLLMVSNIEDRMTAHENLIQALFDALNKTEIFCKMSVEDLKALQDKATLLSGAVQEARNSYRADLKTMQRRIGRLLGEIGGPDKNTPGNEQ